MEHFIEIESLPKRFNSSPADQSQSHAQNIRGPTLIFYENFSHVLELISTTDIPKFRSKTL